MALTAQSAPLTDRRDHPRLTKASRTASMSAWVSSETALPPQTSSTAIAGEVYLEPSPL